MVKARIAAALVGLNFGRHIVEAELLGGNGREAIDLVGVCDFDRKRAEEIAGRHGLRCFRSIEEILKEPAVEAVLLYTPPHGRARLVEQCLLAGKHVMTTKPFEDDAKAAFRALSMARARGQVVHLNSPAPLPSDEFALFAQWRREFRLGRPVTAFWETHARYDEEADGSWMDDPNLCPAAPIFRLGIYGICDLIELCGPAAECRLIQSRTETGRPTADNGMLTVRFVNGCIGCIASSFRIDNGAPYRNTLIVHYEHGTVSRSLPDALTPEAAIRVSLQARGSDGVPFVRQEALGTSNRSGQYQWSEFMRAIREGRTIDPEYIGRIIGSIELVRDFREQASAALFQLAR